MIGSRLLGAALGCVVVSACPASTTNEYGKLPEADGHLRRVSDYVEHTPQPDYHHASNAAVEAFHDLKYGVRIHFGLYSLRGDASWPLLNMSNEQRHEYQESYHTFNPTNFNAEQWMQLFQTNGVKMFAITTKHHDGFSMFDTHTRVKSRVEARDWDGFFAHLARDKNARYFDGVGALWLLGQVMPDFVLERTAYAQWFDGGDASAVTFTSGVLS